MNENQNPYESPVMAELVEKPMSRWHKTMGYVLLSILTCSALSCVPEPFLTIVLVLLCVGILAIKFTYAA